MGLRKGGGGAESSGTMLSFNKLFFPVAVAGVALGFLPGCRKKAAEIATPETAVSVAVVKPTERSAHFAAVTNHLELGGTVYGYVDVDGDVAKLAVVLQNLAKQAAASQPMAKAFVPDDLAPFFTDLGLTDVKAVGFSSVAAEDGGFRNRVFFYMPDGRHGLFAGLGGEPASFGVARLAPADADLVYETEFDAPAVYAAIRAVVARGAGEPAAKLMDAKLDEQPVDAPFPPRELLDGAKGRFSLVLRIDETRTFAFGPADFTAPAFDLALGQERGGAKLAIALAKDSYFEREERAGGVTAFVLKQELPILGWRPEILIEGDTILAVSRAGFLSPDDAKLADDPAYRSALAALGETGNGLTYVGPRLATRVARIAELNPELPPEQALMLRRFLGALPEAGTTLVSTRQNLPEGILLRSKWNSSLKSDLVMANPGVVVGTGLVAAMAIPAFQKVRANSQEKVALNNLRQLAAARDQYFLENGKTSCTYADLVGPDKYIREIKPVAGEDYTGLNFREGEPLRVRLRTGKVVEYSY